MSFRLTGFALAAALLGGEAAAQKMVVLPATADAWITSGTASYGDTLAWEATKSYGSMSEVQVSNWPGVRQVGLFRWEVDSQGRTPRTATVFLYLTRPSAASFEIDAMSATWIASEATWTKATSVSSWQVAGAGAPDRGSVQFTIPAGATGWVSGSHTGIQGLLPGIFSLSVVVDALSASDDLGIASAEHPVAARRPRLVIDYTDNTTWEYQQGMKPTTAYAGASDTTIANGTTPATTPMPPGIEARPGAAALIRFDTSNLPGEIAVTSAKLKLSLQGVSTSQSLSIHQVLPPWLESVVTWKYAGNGTLWSVPGLSAGVDYGPSLIGIALTGSGPVAVALGQPGALAVERWAKTPASNQGLVLLSALPASDSVFASREWGNAAQHPQLEVSYFDSKLLFASSQAWVGVGNSGGAFELELVQPSGAPFVSAWPASLTVSSSSPSGAFSTSPSPTGNWWPATTVVVPGGSSRSQPFWFRDRRTGTWTINARSGPSTMAGSSTINTHPFILSEDFETGTLLATANPPGQWHELVQTFGSDQIAPDPSAAHRGAGGVHVHNFGVPGSAGPQAHLLYRTGQIDEPAYLRGWVRVKVSNGQGDVQLVAIGCDTTTPPADLVAAVSYDFQNGALLLGGQREGGPTVKTVPFKLEVGRWYLFEVGMSDASINGYRRLWIDAALVAEETGFSLADPGYRPRKFYLGPAWSKVRSFQGVIDYDDVRVAAVPQPSRLLLDVPTKAAPGDCVKALVSLATSLPGQLADAPFVVDGQLSVTGAPGTFFSDPACTRPAGGFRIPVDGRTTEVYFSPSGNGIAALQASHVDFVPGAATVVVRDTLNLQPAAARVAPGGVIAFAASGGLPPYTWSLEQNASGATLDPEGRYHAGASAGMDVVKAKDASGLSGSATVMVGAVVQVTVSIEGGERARPIGSAASGTVTVENRLPVPQAGLSLRLAPEQLALEPISAEPATGCGEHCYALAELGPGESRGFPFAGRLEGAPQSEAAMTAVLESSGEELSASRAPLGRLLPLTATLGCGCASAGAAALPLLAFVLLLRRRRL
ncbi:MAG: DNRLRE domain-containing protein [Myxococcales bacterium]|nr:DNRLRE domain-containing protein [Myxococcales bacterium]